MAKCNQLTPHLLLLAVRLYVLFS